jgi:hypothetical protein
MYEKLSARRRWNRPQPPNDTQFDDLEREHIGLAPAHDSDQLNYGSTRQTPESEAFFLPCTQELNFGG